MILAFELSMPSNNAWNGRWSGDGECYAIVRAFRKGWPTTIDGAPIPERATYSFGDGWVAAVSVREVNRGDAARLRRRTRGFCGYDWMVESLLCVGRILTREALREELQKRRANVPDGDS